MVSELQDIIDQIVILQNAITPPSGEKDITGAYDEPPDLISTFPCFVNLEEEGKDVVNPGNWGYVTYTIGMHLLFAPAGTKYSVRARRKWVLPVLAKFSLLANRSLGDTANHTYFTGFNYDPFEWGGTSYVAANFMLAVKVGVNWEG